MPTLSEAIKEKYAALYMKLSPLGDFLPAPDKVIPADVCLLVSMVFTPHYDEYDSDFRPAIKEAAGFQGFAPSPEQMEEAYPHIAEFLNWLIPILKEKRA